MERNKLLCQNIERKYMQTPWGSSQSQKTIASGIVFYSTSSHGGIKLSSERVKQMPDDLRNFGSTAPGWYEEDCEYSIVVLAFPELFKPEDFYFAVGSCKSYYPELVTPERQAIADAWLAKNGDKWASGCQGTADKGWFVNIYNLVTGERRSKVFSGVVTLPGTVFTLEQFENETKLFDPHDLRISEQAEMAL